MKLFEIRTLLCVAIILGMTLLVQVEGASAGDTTTPPVGARAVTPNYVTDSTGASSMSAATVSAAASGKIIRVYKDYVAWFEEDRDSATLSFLGKTIGVDWFIHPVSDCAAGIPADTGVVLFTSNSYPDYETTTLQNDPACQANLKTFLSTGGVLIADMADNDSYGGFIAPGSEGTPAYYIFPEPWHQATLEPAASSHPIVVGPDGIAGTSDDLTDDNIDMCDGCRYVAHGNLEDGITLPLNATTIMTAAFPDAKPIVAEYCYGAGRVILDTVTKEFTDHQPSGLGRSYFMTNLFSYALADASSFTCIAATVEKDYRKANVCFEKDNDGDGRFGEDPVDRIDNDGDGRRDEDPVECAGQTSLGDPLSSKDVDGNFFVNAVMRKNIVTTYNPSPYYAVSTVRALTDMTQLVITETFGDCTEAPKRLNALSAGPGSVVIVEVGEDGVARQIFDAKSPNVSVSDTNSNGIPDKAEATLMNVPANVTVLMYVKFEPGLKGLPMVDPPLDVCLNEAAAATTVNGGIFSSSAQAGFKVKR